MAYMQTVFLAETVFRWLPSGTHDWNKFILPQELSATLKELGMEVRDVSGMIFQPMARKWVLDSSDVSVNYILCAQKLEHPKSINT